MSFDGNSQKTPLAQSLQRIADNRARDVTEGKGKVLPCTVAEVISPGVVRVNFQVNSPSGALPQVIMPVGKPPYITYPIQVGDAGVAISADARLGALTGLGGGMPNIQDTVGNLSAMTFFWLGKKTETTPDPEALVLYENILVTPSELSFFGGSKHSKQAVTGAVSAIMDGNAKAVLESLILALAAYGLIKNETS